MAIALLIVGTALAVPLLILAVFGRTSMSVNGVLERPYTVEFDDGRSVEVAEATVAYVNFDIGQEGALLASPPRVEAQVKVAREDSDARWVIAGFLGVVLTAAWVILTGLRRVVADALEARPFTEANARRLRFIGWIVLGLPVVTALAGWAITATLDTDPAFRVAIPGPSMLLLVVIGLGLLGLSELFLEAVRLREFEEATI